MLTIFSFLFIAILVSIVYFNLIECQEYVVQQGLDDHGTPYIYSPYILWNTQLNPHPNSLVTPIKIYSTNGFLNLTLTIKATTIINELFSFRTRSYCYQGICS